MDLYEFLEYLRRSNQDDADLTLARAHIEASPIMSAELLDLFNCIVDVRSAENDARIAARHKK